MVNSSLAEQSPLFPLIRYSEIRDTGMSRSLFGRRGGRIARLIAFPGLRLAEGRGRVLGGVLL